MPPRPKSGFQHVYPTPRGQWSSRGVKGVFDTPFAAAEARYVQLGGVKPTFPNLNQRCVWLQHTDHQCSRLFSELNPHSRLCEQHWQDAVVSYERISSNIRRRERELAEMRKDQLKLYETFRDELTDGTIPWKHPEVEETGM